MYVHTFIHCLYIVLAPRARDERPVDAAAPWQGIFASQDFDVCMYVYICIYIYIYMYTYTLVNIYIYIHRYLYTYIHIYARTLMYTRSP